MKKDKRNNIIFNIAAVLLCLTLLSTYMVSGTYAKFTNSGNSKDSARVAKYVFDVKNGATGEEISLNQIVKPGDSQKLQLTVTNSKNEVTSEVAENCNIKIEYIGSMPLIIELLEEKTKVASLDAKSITEDEPLISDEAAGASMEASVSTSKTYELSVSWPSTENDIKYANAASCGKIIITINGEQID